ncbi:MAG: dihydropyrimidinase, partial [Pseudomonadota bacterium]
IVEGADADIVVWDPKITKTISASTHRSVLDYNVFEGTGVSAQARYTLSRGEVIWAWGQNDQPNPGRGKFVPRPPFPSAHAALSKWKETTAPKHIKRDPMNIPAGI